MKTILVGLFVFTSLVNTQAQSNEKTSEMISQLSGCFDVTFEFSEINVLANYPIKSDYYLEHAKELVIVDKKSEDEVHLQHMLIAGGSVIKHWREEWHRTSTQNSLIQYTDVQTWSANPIASSDANNWIQYVSSVDDSPRFGCAANWEGTSWNCSTLAPLPRRESKRKDYQILGRSNKIVVRENGWTHFELNQKIKLNGDQKEVIASEIGSNTYTKTASESCAVAQEMWNSQKIYWNLVQDMWKHIMSHHGTIKLKKEVGGLPLGKELADLIQNWNTFAGFDEKIFSKAVHDLIHTYMEE